MPDYFTIHPEALEGQPKRVLVQYAAANGLPTAPILDSDHAKDYIIARTEHQQDYAGDSGLVDSPVLAPGETLNSRKLSLASEALRLRCVLRGESIEDYLRDVSFSFWKFLDGYNHKIVADSGVEGRYHMFSVGPMIHGKLAPESAGVYHMIDQGTVVRKISKGDIPVCVEEFVELYEGLRSLDRLDKKHCYLVEAQSSMEARNPVLLQALRTRDCTPADFEVRTTVIGVDFVRGVVPQRVFEIPVHLEEYCGIYSLRHENARFDDGSLRLFSQLIAPDLDLYVVGAGAENFIRLQLDPQHNLSTLLFRPKVTIVLDRGTGAKLYDRFHTTVRQAIRTGRDQSFHIEVSADGRNSSVRLV